MCGNGQKDSHSPNWAAGQTSTQGDYVNEHCDYEFPSSTNVTALYIDEYGTCCYACQQNLTRSREERLKVNFVYGEGLVTEVSLLANGSYVSYCVPY